MTPKKNTHIIGNLFQFSPFIIFLTIYSSLYFYTLHTKNLYNSSTIILTGLPLFAAFVATFYDFLNFKNPLKINKKIEIFLSGVAHPTAINYYFIIICISIFNHLIAKTNGILTAVTLGLLYIPISWIMPFIFLIVSIFSMIINFLPATILICMPIAYGIAQSLQINSAFMAATIIGGALYGSHLSLYFKNIQSYIKTTHINLTFFFQETSWFIIPAAISTLIILSQYQCQQIEPNAYHYLQSSLTIYDYIPLIPYLFLLISSFLQINILVNLIIASTITLINEIIYHKVIFIDAIATMFNGFYANNIAVNILMLHLIIAGLTKIIKYNGGFNYMIEKFKLKGAQSPSNVQGSILLITICVNILVIIETLSLSLISYPIEKIADKYNISKNKLTILLHITTTTMQTILPYSFIMFSSISMNNSSYIEIVNYMIYPILITISTVIFIFTSKKNINSEPLTTG